MKKIKGVTNRIAAMMLSGMLAVGSVPGTVLAADFQIDPGQTSVVAAEELEEIPSEETPMEESVEEGMFSEEAPVEDNGQSEAPQEDNAVTSYTVTLDANGGYFENVRDDVLNDTLEETETVTKLIPVGETVADFPVYVDQDGQSKVFAGWSLERDGELITTGDEEYAPLNNCDLYAAWKDDGSSNSLVLEEMPQEESDNSNIESSEQTDTEWESGETGTPEESDVDFQETAIPEIFDGMESEEGSNYEPEGFSSDETIFDTEDNQDETAMQEDNNLNEDIDENTEEYSDTAVAEEETEVELIESSEEEEIVREDATKGVVSSGTCGKNLSWALDNAGTLSISGSGEMDDYTDGGPWERKAVKTIDIENGVTSIGDYAFYKCENLVNVSIPTTVKKIGIWAFQDCLNLPSVIIPSGVTVIGKAAFRYCFGLNNVLLPNGLLSIEEEAFAGCKSIESLQLPSSVCSIGSDAFTNCQNLTSITLPNSLNKIEVSTFSYCEKLQSITIPQSVTEIGEFAFEYCESLKRIIIPTKVTSIGRFAFFNCKSLTNIEIPPSVNNIGESAFSQCSSNLVIYGAKGSYAEQYAKDNGIDFIVVDFPNETQQFNIHFDLAGGTLPVNIDYQVTNGEKYGYNLTYEPERPGYNFLGWFTAAKNGTQITEGTVVNLTADQTLYAHWKEGTYVVTFNPNGGTVTPTSKTYTGYTTYGSLPVPVKSGYAFGGWYRRYKGEDDRIEANKEILFYEHTVKARWEHIVEFDANGGTVAHKTKKIIDEDKYGEMPVPERSGYTFDGWFKSLNGEDQVMEYDNINLTSSSELLYAHWSIKLPYSIDHWNFPNSSDYFGRSYYITDSDKKKLYKNLSEKEVKLIEEEYFSKPLFKDDSPSGYGEPQKIKPRWTGSCHGMTLWSILVYAGEKEAGVINEKNKLSDYNSTDIVQSGINFYQAQTQLDNYVKEARKFVVKHQDAQIEELERMLSSDVINTSTGVPVHILIDYAEHYSKGDGKFIGGGQHAIVGYSLKQGDFTSDVIESMKSIGRESAIKDTWKFSELIYIYDPNNPDNVTGLYISKNTENYIWCYPFLGLVSTDSFSSDPKNHSNNAFLGICTNDADLLSGVDYTDGSICYNRNSNQKLPTNISTNIANWSLECRGNDGKNYHWDISEKTSSGEEKLLIMSNPGEADDTTGKIVFPPEAETYSIKTDNEPVDFILNTEKMLTIIQTGSSGTAIIEKQKASVIPSENTDIRVSLTSNDSISGTSWHTIEAVSKNAEKLSLYPSENGGAIVSGDLNNLTITTIDDNRIEDEEEWPISTDCDSILIKEEAGELVSYVDNDGDGSYESPLEELSTIDSGTCGDNLTWILNDRGTLTISGTGNMKDYEGSFGGPWKKHKEEIKKIIIKNGVSSIGAFAFNQCKELQKLTIPGSVETVRELAFNNCTRLEELSLADGVTTIDREAFCFCESLKKLVIPDSVTSIGNDAFHGCKSLTSLTISKNVTRIGEYAFGWCESLIELLIPANVTAIGDNAFYNCKSLTDLTISPGVQSIGASAFSNCNNLSSVIIPNSVKSIAQNAFERSLSDDFEKRLIIYGEKDSSAEALASDSSCIFIYLNARTIENAVITVPDQTYNATAHFPALDVKVNGVSLAKDTDYLVKFSNNFKIGEATVKIIGIKNYKGYAIAKFKINKGIQHIYVTTSSSSISLWDTATVTITGAIGRTSFKSSDTSIATVDNQGKVTPVYPGKVKITATVNGNANYKEASASVTIEVQAISINKATVEDLQEKTWTGKAQTQNPKVKVNGNLLNSCSDYKISYKNNVNVGTATIIITGKGYFGGSVTRTFKIKKAAQSLTTNSTTSSIAVGKSATVSITGNKGTKSYRSSNAKIAMVNSKGVVTAKKVGTVKITATSAATANYNAASKTVTIKVVPAATASLKADNQATGIKLTWKKVTGANGYKVYRGSTLIKTITSGSTVTFADTKANTNGTKYTYKVVAKAATGDSTLSKSVAVYRVARPAVSSVTNRAASKMTVKWGKNAKATGYQIQYSTDKNFKSGNKAVTVAGASAVSKVIGSLTKSKTYYVRIRTCKTVGSAKYWSVWSAAKSVKISK